MIQSRSVLAEPSLAMPTIKDFVRVAEAKKIDADHVADRIMELIDNPQPTGETIEELARLLGQSE